MEPAVLRIYSDYKSPYAYVHKAASYQLEADYRITLEWRPYTLNIPLYLGTTEDRNDHQWRRVRYSYMDARRLANQQGLVVRGPQKIFDSRLAHMGMLFAQQHGVFHAYHDAVFDRFWKRELDIESVDALSALLAEVGADGPAFAAYAAGPGVAALVQVQAEAEAAGVFGVPMYVVNGELYWGGDRLPMVRDALDRAGLRRG
ncbi:MAG TPA: DsbA family protein [bacterium]